MIMDLPKKFSIGNSKDKNDAFVENGILKIRNTASFRVVLYELTFYLSGGKHICKYCKKKIVDTKITIDHMYPKNVGGPTITNNLIPACQECNSEKTDMTKKQYKIYRGLSKGEKEKYLKKIRAENEKMRKKHQYRIPSEWITKKQISTIFIAITLENCTQYHKYKKLRDFYATYGYFPQPIIVDKNGFLLDGFYAVMYAKNNGITTIPTIQLENVEVIF